MIANAGGLNPEACRRAIEKAAEQAGVTIRVGTVEGDDLMAKVEKLRGHAREIDSGARCPRS